MLDLYRWQREQAVICEQRDWRNSHAYTMSKVAAKGELGLRGRMAHALRHASFHLTPNREWSRDVAW